MRFPARRPRRLRRSPLLRGMVQETHVSAADLIAPLFVKEGIDKPIPITSMPGQVQHTLASVIDACGELAELGVPAVILFGIPNEKDGQGTQAFADDGIVQRALAALRAEYGDRLVLIADLCLCEYTDHGHCGIVRGGSIDNDATLEVYAKTAVSQAKAGADLIGPSGMMDGQVAAIRRALD
ncbi:MAG: porphobilinogen synthase, partial [Armatimonadetes bacterium]|nr:porphobilinogen synthase [Armatimonadota bacterium]